MKFPKASDRKGRLRNTDAHGGNHAPSEDDWWDGDDTLDRQGGHGICKGVATSWVIAFLNSVEGASVPSKYEAYYTNFLRFQATMIKDSGSHIDTHVTTLNSLHLATNVTVQAPVEIINFSESNIPSGRWGAYVSVWGHDIALGGTDGASGTLFINEPNSGLMGYDSAGDFVEDLNGYLNKRRLKKSKPANAAGKYWFCS